MNETLSPLANSARATELPARQSTRFPPRASKLSDCVNNVRELICAGVVDTQPALNSRLSSRSISFMAKLLGARELNVSTVQVLSIVAAATAISAVAQWKVMRHFHGKATRTLRSRHLAAQESIAAMLQQARLQNERTQKELAALRLAVTPTSRVKANQPSTDTAVRESLHKMLDAAPSVVSRLPVDGFADTLPSRQFANTSSFGLLHRASTFAGR